MWDLERVCSWPAWVKEEICRATSFISSGTTPDHPFGGAVREQFLETQKCPGHEDDHCEIDQPEMPDRVEVVRVVSGKGDNEAEHGRDDGTDQRPQMASSHAEPHEEGDRYTSSGDETGDRNVEMPNVVVQRGAELDDLVLADAHFVLTDAELEKAVGVVADKEDHRVADEAEGRDEHQRRTRPQCLRFYAG